MSANDTTIRQLFPDKQASEILDGHATTMAKIEPGNGFFPTVPEHITSYSTVASSKSPYHVTGFCILELIVSMV